MSEMQKMAGIKRMVHVYVADITGLPDPLETQQVMKGLSERDAAEEMNLPRNTYTYRRSKLFCRLKNLLKDTGEIL